MSLCIKVKDPEGNSLVERWNQSLKNILHHIFIFDDPRSWDRKIPYLLWAYREIPNATTGLSPYQLVFRWVGRGPLSVLKDTWADDLADPPVVPGNASEYLEKLKTIFRLVRTSPRLMPKVRSGPMPTIIT